MVPITKRASASKGGRERSPRDGRAPSRISLVHQNRTMTYQRRKSGKCCRHHHYDILHSLQYHHPSNSVCHSEDFDVHSMVGQIWSIRSRDRLIHQHLSISRMLSWKRVFALHVCVSMPRESTKRSFVMMGRACFLSLCTYVRRWPSILRSIRWWSSSNSYSMTHHPLEWGLCILPEWLQKKFSFWTKRSSSFAKYGTEMSPIS